MPGIGTAIGAGVGAVVGLFLDYLSLREEGSQNTYW
jgi:uncharacterized membrane protein